MLQRAISTALALSASLTSFGLLAAEPYDLTFNSNNYQTQTVTFNGKTLEVRAYENLVYVKNPVDTEYQIINIYIPQAYFEGKTINGYNAATAPIFLPNQVGGYMPAKPGVAVAKEQSEQRGAATIAAALQQGLVVASPGARGRTTKTETGVYTGKAPAVIVDLKAAVRYLRYNDARMPGDAEKIISNGTSAGGAVSSLLGASGGSQDYEPYLATLGAAPADDRIFAVSAYCPITNLDHADSAYEWQFNGVNDYKQIQVNMLDYHVTRTEVLGTLDTAQIAVSDQLKPHFGEYLNGLNLHSPDGNRLQLDAKGNGSFKTYLESYLLASAQRALDGGNDLADKTWLQIENGKAVAMDFDAYVRAIGRMKTPPAFDALDLSNAENQLFGTAQIDAQHFTLYSQQHSSQESKMADEQIIKMMNPMNYLQDKHGVAAHWRIRHGTIDRDTSLAIPLILATALENQGYNPDFALAWDRPHSGDYDLEELFAWIKQITAQ